MKRFRSIRLVQLLNSLNLSLADLLILPSVATGDTKLCYNYFMGRCVHSGCTHKHVDVEDITDEFATALVTLLQPAITNFMMNGAPNPRRKRKRRTE